MTETVEQTVDGRALYAKLTWRLIPYMFLLYIVAYMDRVNVGFAALSMNKAIGLTPAMFGFGVTVVRRPV